MTEKVVPQTGKGKGKDGQAGQAAGAGTKPVKERKTRKDFDIKSAMVQVDGKLVSCVDDKGKLTAFPVTVKDGDGKVLYEGFSPLLHKPLKKGDFADIASFMIYQASGLRLRGKRLIDMADKREKQAEQLRKFGDETARKRAQKYARMKDQMAKLKEQLKEEGIDVEDIDEEPGSEAEKVVEPVTATA